MIRKEKKDEKKKEEQEEKEETAPLNEEKEDGREEKTKHDPTNLLNDGRTDLNEKGKEATRKIKESARMRREKDEKAGREEYRRRENEERRKEQERTDDRNAIISNEKQVPRIQNQVFVIKTDKVTIYGNTLQEAVNQANKHEMYIRNAFAKSKSHEEAERIGLVKGFPQGMSLSITRIPDRRAKDSQHNKTRIYWADNLPSAIGARTILTLTNRQTSKNNVRTNKSEIWLDRATIQFRFLRPASRYTGSFCVFGPVLSSPAHGLPSLAMDLI
jgi:hypothetical protein